MENLWTFVFKDFVDLVNRLVNLVFFLIHGFYGFISRILRERLIHGHSCSESKIFSNFAV